MTSLSDRYINGGELLDLVDADANREVLRYLAEHRPSCHSDPGGALIKSAEKCGEWIAYSPSFANCAYVALITRRRIFALGIGQRTVCYRLSASSHAIALQTGATELAELGTEWACFELYRPDWPQADLPFWALQAYVNARTAY